MTAAQSASTTPNAWPLPGSYGIPRRECSISRPPPNPHPLLLVFMLFLSLSSSAVVAAVAGASPATVTAGSLYYQQPPDDFPARAILLAPWGAQHHRRLLRCPLPSRPHPYPPFHALLLLRLRRRPHIQDLSTSSKTMSHFQSSSRIAPLGSHGSMTRITGSMRMARAFSMTVRRTSTTGTAQKDSTTRSIPPATRTSLRRASTATHLRTCTIGTSRDSSSLPR